MHSYSHNNKFNHQQYTPTTEHRDNVPGQLYLIEAIGYHGMFPGCFLRRVKIGLSRNPQLRLETFHANQPPCDLRILRTINVRDMKTCEDWLHRKFQRCNVKLNRSREWFDVSPFDFIAVQWAFDELERQNNSIPVSRVTQLIVGVALVALGLSIGLLFHQPQSSQQLHQQPRSGINR